MNYMNICSCFTRDSRTYLFLCFLRWKTMNKKHDVFDVRVINFEARHQTQLPRGPMPSARFTGWRVENSLPFPSHPWTTSTTPSCSFWRWSGSRNSLPDDFILARCLWCGSTTSIGNNPGVPNETGLLNVVAHVWLISSGLEKTFSICFPSTRVARLGCGSRLENFVNRLR